jgi:hypothetical protein
MIGRQAAAEDAPLFADMQPRQSRDRERDKTDDRLRRARGDLAPALADGSRQDMRRLEAEQSGKML